MFSRPSASNQLLAKIMLTGLIQWHDSAWNFLPEVRRLTIHQEAYSNMGEPQPIDPTVLQATKASLTEDRAAFPLFAPGTFFDDSSYFDSLPRDAKALICAIQHVGPSPSRPGFCNDQALRTLAAFNRNRSRNTIDTSVALHAMAIKYMTANDPNCVTYVSNLGKAFQRKWEVFGEMADLNSMIEWYRKTTFVAEDSPLLVIYVTDLATALTKRILKTKEGFDDNEAECAYHRASRLAEATPLYGLMLSNEGENARLCVNVLRSKDHSKLSHSIDLQLEAVRLVEEDMVPAEYRARIYRNIVRTYNDRFRLSHGDDDSRSALKYFEKGIQIVTPGGSDYCWLSNDIGEFYWERYKVYGKEIDIHKAIEKFQDVLHVQEGNLVASKWLAECLRALAENSVHRQLAEEHLNKADALLQECLTHADGEDNQHGWLLDRRSAVSQELFEIDGDPAHLDDAVEYSQKASQFTEEATWWNFQRNLSGSLIKRYEHQRDFSDLEHATTAIDKAIDATDPGSSDYAQCLWGRGKILRKAHDANRRIETIRKAIGAFSDAESSCGQNLKTRALVRNDLGNAYCQLFQFTGARQDIDDGIESYNRALTGIHQSLLPQSHQDESMILSCLGVAFLYRHNQWHSIDDLDASINYIRSSLKEITEANPRFLKRAANLSYGLQLKYDLQKDSKGSIALLREAQDLTKRALEAPMKFSNGTICGLQTHMGNIFVRLGGLGNLDLAIKHYRLALEAGSIEQIETATATMDLAVAMKAKSSLTEVVEDSLEALEMFRNAMKLLSPGDPLMKAVQWNMANLLSDLAEDGAVKKQYKQEAIQFYLSLAEDRNIDARHRISAYDHASRLTFLLKAEPKISRDYLVKAVNLLPEAVLLYSNRVEQLRIIREFHFLPSSAAAMSMAAESSLSNTVQLLESGRGLIWDRLLNERTVIDDLLEKHKELGEKFQRLRQALFQPAVQDISKEADMPTALREKDSLRFKRQKTAEEFSALLEEVRQEDGFRDFLRVSNDMMSLQKYAEDGPVVFVNASRYRSDALVITKTKVFSLNLPEYTMDSIIQNAGQVTFATREVDDKDKSFETRTAYLRGMKWLWTVAAKPILDSIDWAPYQTGKEAKPRMYWVSTGWSNILPFHAAGDFTSESPQAEPRSVHDRVVASYIPSLKVLEFVRAQALAKELKCREITRAPTAMLVEMPKTPGMGAEYDLDTKPELDAVESRLKNYGQIERLESPTLQRVQASLQNCALVHFACHGIAHDSDPSRSAMRLQDWKKNPLSVRVLLKSRIDRCQLAYLSACETSMNKDFLLRDEGIHMAGGFQMAGVPHTVSALWPISDSVSRDLAGAFYAGVAGEDGTIHFGRTAYALHEAVQIMREKGVHPLLWSAYIHSGP